MSRPFLVGHICEVLSEWGDQRLVRMCLEPARSCESRDAETMLNSANRYERWRIFKVRGAFPSCSPLYSYMVTPESTAAYAAATAGSDEPVRMIVLHVMRTVDEDDNDSDERLNEPMCRMAHGEPFERLVRALVQLELRETQGSGNPSNDNWDAYERKRAAQVKKMAALTSLAEALRTSDEHGIGENQLRALCNRCGNGRFAHWSARAFGERVFWEHSAAKVALLVGTDAVERMRPSEHGRALMERIMVAPWLVPMLDESIFRDDFFRPATGSIRAIGKRDVEMRLQCLIEMAEQEGSTVPEEERQAYRDTLRICRVRWAIFDDLQGRMRGYGAIGSTVDDAERARLGSTRDEILEAVGDMERSGVLKLCAGHRSQPYFFTNVWHHDALLHAAISDLLQQARPEEPRTQAQAGSAVPDDHVAAFLRTAIESPLTLLSAEAGVTPYDYIQPLIDRLDQECVVALCDPSPEDQCIAAENRVLARDLISATERHVAFAIGQKRLSTLIVVRAHRLDSHQLLQALRNAGESITRVVLVIDDRSRGVRSEGLLTPNPCRVLWTANVGRCIEARRNAAAADLPLTARVCASLFAPERPGPQVVVYDRNDARARELANARDLIVLAPGAEERRNYARAYFAERQRSPDDYPHRILCKTDIAYFRHEHWLATISHYYIEQSSGAHIYRADAFDARQLPADAVAVTFAVRVLNENNRERTVRIRCYDGRIGGVDHGRFLLLHQLPSVKAAHFALICSERTRSEHLYAAAEMCAGAAELLLLGESPEQIERERREAAHRRPFGAITPLAVMLQADREPAAAAQPNKRARYEKEDKRS